MADFIAATCERIRSETMINHVVLSGDTFQNRYLIGRLSDKLKDKEFVPHFHRSVPTNDGGVSLGQAVVAGAQMNAF